MRNLGHWKVPGARQVRGSQDPTRMTFVKMHSEWGDRDHLQCLDMTPSRGMGPPTHFKVFNPVMFLSKRNTGTKTWIRD